MARIALTPMRLHWITEDAAIDQCAHGDVVFTIDSIPFVTGEDAESVTVALRAFYDEQPPRRRPDDDHDAEGWLAFWREWDERRGAAGRPA